MTHSIYDSDVDTTDRFSPLRKKVELQQLSAGARTLIMLTAIGGGTLCFTQAGHIGRLAAYNAGLAMLIWTGHMVVGAGALRGHLALFRLIEHTARAERAHLDQQFAALHARLDATESRAEERFRHWRDTEHGVERLLADVAQAAGDELGHRRNGRQ